MNGEGQEQEAEADMTSIQQQHAPREVASQPQRPRTTSELCDMMGNTLQKQSNDRHGAINMASYKMDCMSAVSKRQRARDMRQGHPYCER